MTATRLQDNRKEEDIFLSTAISPVEKAAVGGTDECGAGFEAACQSANQSEGVSE